MHHQHHCNNMLIQHIPDVIGAANKRDLRGPGRGSCARGEAKPRDGEQQGLLYPEPCTLHPCPVQGGGHMRLGKLNLEIAISGACNTLNPAP